MIIKSNSAGTGTYTAYRLESPEIQIRHEAHLLEVLLGEECVRQSNIYLSSLLQPFYLNLSRLELATPPVNQISLPAAYSIN